MNKAADTKTVLVIEDDPTVLMFLEDGLEEQGYAGVSARSSGEALNMLGRKSASKKELAEAARIQADQAEARARQAEAEAASERSGA